jgi:hypothetical protein
MASPPPSGKMESSSSEAPPPRPEDGKCAIDDSADEDEESAQMMRIKSADQYRTKHDKKKGIRVQEILPFHFSPIFLPLTESHLESTLALENAAFTNPSHRCSRDKVRLPRPHPQKHLLTCLLARIPPGPLLRYQLRPLLHGQAVRGKGFWPRDRRRRQPRRDEPRRRRRSCPLRPCRLHPRQRPCRDRRRHGLPEELA